MKLLEFCLSATFLSFHGGVYQQTFGTVMGSPVTVTIANLVMEDVERALATTDIPLEVLEVLCGQHLRGTPSLKSAGVLGPPQWGTQYSVHS